MNYTITERVRTNFVDDTGVAVDGYRVFYRMTDGTVDYVQVKKSQFSAEVVKAAIEEEIAVHEALMS